MSVSLKEYMGDGRRHAPLSSNLTLKVGWPRLHTLDPDAARDVTLPDARLLPPGGPHFILLNIDAAFSVTVRDGAAGVLLTLGPLEGVVLSLASSPDAAGRWSSYKRAL